MGPWTWPRLQQVASDHRPRTRAQPSGISPSYPWGPPRRRPSALRRRSVDAMFDGVTHQLLPTVEVKLVEDVADMVLDGFRRDVQHLADLLVGIATSDVLEHLSFPFGERVGPGRLGREPTELSQH